MRHSCNWVLDSIHFLWWSFGGLFMSLCILYSKAVSQSMNKDPRCCRQLSWSLRCLFSMPDTIRTFCQISAFSRFFSRLLPFLTRFLARRTFKFSLRFYAKIITIFFFRTIFLFEISKLLFDINTKNSPLFMYFQEMT